ncbi:MAG: 30S ribosomal protein S17 [Phycisphaerales bacterium]|nr:30S ribosomal protein S17 [Phycisphaerales bacterium]
MAEKKDIPMRTGVVTSDKRDKTRKVEVQFLAKHPKYGKYLRQRTVLHVHDEKNDARMGDKVEIEECRPISKTKSWRLVRVVERAPEEVSMREG